MLNARTRQAREANVFRLATHKAVARMSARHIVKSAESGRASSFPEAQKSSSLAHKLHHRPTLVVHERRHSTKYGVDALEHGSPGIQFHPARV